MSLDSSLMGMGMGKFLNILEPTFWFPVFFFKKKNQNYNEEGRLKEIAR